jgi:hypothetical protein
MLHASKNKSSADRADAYASRGPRKLYHQFNPARIVYGDDVRARFARVLLGAGYARWELGGKPRLCAKRADGECWSVGPRKTREVTALTWSDMLMCADHAGLDMGDIASIVRGAELPRAIHARGWWRLEPARVREAREGRFHANPRDLARFAHMVGLTALCVSPYQLGVLSRGNSAFTSFCEAVHASMEGGAR